MDKLEKQFKRKLGDRKLVPSEDAWHEIESRLGAKAQQPKKNKWYWYAIAAGFAGMVIISVAYFNKPVVGPQIIDVVDTEMKDEPVLDESVTVENIIEEDVVTTGQKQKIEIKLIEKKNNVLVLPKSLDESIAENTQEKNKIADQKPVKWSEQELIDKKLNEVLAEVTSLENQNIEVTDAEVDSLLWTAQRELMADKIFQENGTIDAMTLLSEVEDELDRTFRGQIFEKLKEGFFKVRTAVADRNN